MKKALLIGANGLIGNYLLKELLESGNYNEVETWTRKPIDNTHYKLVKRFIDFDLIDQMPETHFDDVFCCLGTTIKQAKTKEAFRKVDFNYVVQTAKYAEKVGASKFVVVSSIGADKNSSNFYLRTKGEMEEAIKALSIPAVFILQPSILLGKRNEFRFGEIIGQNAMTLLGVFFIGKMRIYKGIKASDVAKAMRKLAQDDRAGKIIFKSAEIQKIADSLVR